MFEYNEKYLKKQSKYSLNNSISEYEELSNICNHISKKNLHETSL